MSLRVQRVYNNSVIQAVDRRGLQYVVLGPGVGFGVRPKDPVDEARIRQRFVAEQASAARVHLADFVHDIPEAELLVAGEAVSIAHTELGILPSQSLLLPLADHLSFALQKVREGIVVDYPLRWEVTQLYPDEVAVGRQIVALVRQRLGVELPRDEATSFALHLVNAGFGGDGLAPTFAMTETLADVFRIIEDETGADLDRDSMAASRFVTHLRYLFVRLARGESFADPLPLSSLREEAPRAFAIAERLATELSHRQTTDVTPSEINYMALHVARLIGSS